MKLKESYGVIVGLLKKYSYPIALGSLFILAFFLRAYRIASLPNVLYVDEAPLGYNAWCLAHYGVDRYLHELPIYPQNFNGGQSPLYTYSLAILYKVLSDVKDPILLLRIPAMFSSMLAVICFAKMTSMIFHEKRIVLTGTAIITFCPYFIMTGRYALDCNMMFGVSVLAVTLLLYFVQKQTWSSLVACGIGFGLVLYSYSLSYFIIPIFLVACSIYLLYTKKIRISRVIILAGIIIVMGLPIILFVACLLLKIPEIQLGWIHIYPIAEDRMREIAWRDFGATVLECIKLTLTRDISMLEAVDKFYTMYLISLPFILVGFIASLVETARSVWKRYFAVDSIFIFFSVAVILTVNMAEMVRIYRANAIFLSYLYFCIRGIYVCVRWLHHYRKAFGSILFIGYAVWIFSFLRYYFVLYSPADVIKYPTEYYFVPEMQAFNYVAENAEIGNVYIDSLKDEYVTFFYPVSPYEWGNKSPFNANGKFGYVINGDTAIERNSIYMVRKENLEFMERLHNSGEQFDLKEFEYYYVISLP